MSYFGSLEVGSSRKLRFTGFGWFGSYGWIAGELVSVGYIMEYSSTSRAVVRRQLEN